MKRRFTVFAKTNMSSRKRKIVASQDVWDDPKYDRAIDLYLPNKGEGATFAEQIVTAVNKLIYKWYNDHDVFDNVHNNLDGWANDLSSYANWLYKYVPKAQNALDGIYNCDTDEDYEEVLTNLLNACFDAEDLEKWNQQPVRGSIYSCDGPFEFDDHEEDYEEDW